MKAVIFGIVLMFNVAASAQDAESIEKPTDASLEVFVLTPISSTSFSMRVPAGVYGPVANSSCQDWPNHTVNCYLPASELTSAKSARPELRGLLEHHLSALVGAWKPGAWPADGAAITLPLEQYVSMEQLWLTYRLQLHEQVGVSWLDADGDPASQVRQAVTQPAAALDLEVFGETHSAKGYPKKTPF